MQFMDDRRPCLMVETVHILCHHTSHFPKLLPGSKTLVGSVGHYRREAWPPNIVSGPVPLPCFAAVHEVLYNYTDLLSHPITPTHKSQLRYGYKITAWILLSHSINWKTGSKNKDKHLVHNIHHLLLSKV